MPSPIRFAWSGLEGKIEPGKSFTKTELGKKLTAEKGELLKVEFEDTDVVMRANLWARP